MERPARLAGWLALVSLLILVAYLSRATEGKPDPQILYRWSTAIGGVIQDGIILVVVLALAGFDRQLLALGRPRSTSQAVKLVAVWFLGVFAVEIIYGALTHPGNEQGLTPKHWEPAHASAYIVNGIVICTFIPLVEELTYRGLGYSLLERLGRWPAIAAVGLLFGLAHGLIVLLPVIAFFGMVLAWIRSLTRSVLPGMALHALFNLVTLILAVTING